MGDVNSEDRGWEEEGVGAEGEVEAGCGGLHL